MAMMKIENGCETLWYFLNFILNITISGKGLATIHSYPKTRIEFLEMRTYSVCHLIDAMKINTLMLQT